MIKPNDIMTIMRVANGWVLAPGTLALSEYTRVATAPDALAGLVQDWANASVQPPEKPDHDPT